MEASCIINHFEHYAKLEESDKALLRSLEQSPKSYSKNSNVWHQGMPSEHFYTVRKGWVYAYRNMEDGSRQVLDLFVPGDVVGLREFAFSHRITGLMVLRDAELCAFPKARLTEVFAQSNMLCNIFFTIAAMDQAILLERLVNLGRRSARQKLAHFLVEISQRLHKTSAQVDDCLKLPVTQTLLADALGLSAVHVNRTFKELKAEHLIRQDSGEIELLDLEGLKEVAGFDPLYLEQDMEAMLNHARELDGRALTGGASCLS